MRSGKSSRYAFFVILTRKNYINQKMKHIWIILENIKFFIYSLCGSGNSNNDYTAFMPSVVMFIPNLLGI